MFFEASSAIESRIAVADLRTASKSSVSNGSSSRFSFLHQSVSSRLQSNMKGEYFVDVWRLTRWAKRIPSIMLGHIAILSSRTLTREFLIVRFCLSTNPLAWGWYADVTLYLTPVNLWSSVETSFTNSLPWSLIWTWKQPWRHITSNKNWATVDAFRSLVAFSDHFEK